MASLVQINEQIRKTEEQIAALREQAEAIRSEEKHGVIAEAMAKISEYSLTASDLGLATGFAGGRKLRSSKSKEKGAPRYRSPSGEIWHGGRGRKPRWISAALANGKDLAEFEIKR